MKYADHPDDCICPECEGFYISHNTTVKGHDCNDCRKHREAKYRAGIPLAVSKYPMPWDNHQLAYTITSNARYGKNQKAPEEIGMAGINLCDRCDTMFTSAVSTVVNMSSRNEENNLVKEVCPGCADDIFIAINSAPTTDRPKAYKSFPVKNEVKKLECGCLEECDNDRGIE